MLASLSLIFLLGLAMAAICQWLKLPRIVGMLITGIVLGPSALNLLDPTILMISADLCKIALIIILLKAGLSLDLKDLKRVGRPAVMMSCIPSSCEILGFVIFAPMLFHISQIEAAIMGAVLAAASPAIIVPRMVNLMESGRGTGKSVPQLVMAGTAGDDIFVVVLFSTFIGIAQGGSAHVQDFANIPVSIVLGILIGSVVGIILALFFETAFAHKHCVRNSMKIIIILGLAFMLVSLETWLAGVVAVSGLLAVVSMACALKIKSTDFVTKRLSEKLGKLWLAAEVLLFVLVGATVDISYTMGAGIAVIAMLAIALVFRAFGVMICMIKTDLNWRERFFCVITYMPKATVQAAISSVPLSLGLACGNIVLSVAVVGILITAPLGAMAIDYSAGLLLTKRSKV